MRRISASARSSQPSSTTSSPSVSTVPCPPACSVARARPRRLHPSMTAAGVRVDAVPRLVARTIEADRVRGFPRAGSARKRVRGGLAGVKSAISVFKKRVCRNHHVCQRSQSHTSDSDSGILSDADPNHSAPGVPGRPGESGLRVHVLRARRACATQARAHRWPWMSVLFTQLTRRVEYQPLHWGHRGHS
jgi:hypothetical protein